MDLPVPSLGLYRHFKGGLYRVVGTAIDAESAQVYVLYRSIDATVGPVVTWARTVENFSERIQTPDGSEIFRFTEVGRWKSTNGSKASGSN